MSVKFFGTAFSTMMLMAIADSIFQLSITGFSDLNNVLSMDLVTWKEFLIVKIPGSGLVMLLRWLLRVSTL